MISINPAELDIETITRHEIGKLMGVEWKEIKQICYEHNYSLPESVGYANHRGKLFLLEEIMQWLKDCNMAELLEEQKKLKEHQNSKIKKPAGLDNEMASQFLRRSAW